MDASLPETTSDAELARRIAAPEGDARAEAELCRRFALEITLQVEALAEGKRWPLGTFEINHILPV